MKMVNIACGARYHKDWINIDFHPTTYEVKKVNILNGLPFEDNSIDVIYNSHFLEHLNREQARRFLKECHRVLKEDGIIRIVVPDLENICREYLRILELACDGKCEKEYEWIIVELLDQMVRSKKGGEMLKMFLEIESKKDEDLAKYVYYRTGDDLLKLDQKTEKIYKKITVSKIKNKILYLYIELIKLLLPKNLRDLVFINTSIGEKHLWMYDRYSIKKELVRAGFRDVRFMTYKNSQIPNFNSYYLDINQDGSPYKGCSSLYVEARK